MEKFLLNLINFNEDAVNYPFIFTSVFLYIFLLWIAVSIWVMADARKRYHNAFVHLVIFFFILFFNLPALIFYLLVRPDFTFEEEELLEATLYNNRKLDPIIFSGEQGFDINLNVRVTPKVKDERGIHEIDVDVAWVPTDPSPTVEKIKEYEQLHEHVREEKVSGDSNLPFEDFFSALAANTAGFFSNTSHKIKQLFQKIFASGNMRADREVDNIQEDGLNAYDDNTNELSQNPPIKKKKKKNKKK